MPRLPGARAGVVAQHPGGAWHWEKSPSTATSASSGTPGRIGSLAPYRFAHGAYYALPPPLPALFACYHPSQRNTFTRKLTPRMLDALLRRVRRFLQETDGSG